MGPIQISVERLFGRKCVRAYVGVYVTATFWLIHCSRVCRVLRAKSLLIRQTIPVLLMSLSISTIHK